MYVASVMGAAENRELVRRWIDDGWNLGATEDVMADAFAEDWIDGDDPAAPRGHDGVRAFVDTYATAFPGLQIELLQIVADEDFVAFAGARSGPTPGR